MTLLFIYLLLALGVSFLCSVLEAVLLSVSDSYVASLEAKRPGAWRRLKQLKADIERPLAAILSLNTIAHTAGAAGVGAQAAALFGDAFVGIASAIMTLLILVFSEIIPKTLGAAHWRYLAPGVGRIMGPLMWLMWPLVQLARGISHMIGSQGPVPVSREEVSAIAELGAEHGVIGEGESRILRSVFRFESLEARHIMTPRTVLFAMAETGTVGDALPEIQQRPFSRIPLYRASLDEITEYVLKDDILLHGAQDRFQTPLRELARTIKVVPESLALPRLFEQLLDEREHIALVVDEFGGTAGLATVEDVLETLLDMEIVDEADHVEDMREHARRHWEQRARKRGLLATDPAPTAAAQKQGPLTEEDS